MDLLLPNLQFLLFFAFMVAGSIREELNTPTGDSLFAEDGLDVSALAGIIVWICYWIRLNRCRVQLKQRILTQ